MVTDQMEKQVSGMSYHVAKNTEKTYETESFVAGELRRLEKSIASAIVD